MATFIGRTSGIAIVLWTLVIAGGCRSGPIANGTGDEFRRLQVFDRDAADGRFRRYEVDVDGTFQVGSGEQARLGEVAAAPSLDDADVDRLVAALRDAGWFDASPPTSMGDGPRCVEVTLQLHGPTRRFELRADGRRFDVGTASVLAELEAFAGRRFGGVLDALPKGH